MKSNAIFCQSHIYIQRLNPNRAVFINTFNLLFIFLMACQSNQDSDYKKIALDASKTKKGLAALNKITNEKELSEIAIYAKNDEIKVAAVKLLSDQYEIAEVAWWNPDSEANTIANLMLTDPSILQLRKAIDSIPKEHKGRIYLDIMPIISIINDKEFINKYGDLSSINLSWKSLNEEYSNGGNMNGESVSCSIFLKNLKDPLSHSWRTYFPNIAFNLRFKSAEIKPGDLISPILNEFSESFIKKIAAENKFEIIRSTAVEHITDQLFLSKVSLEDPSDMVRLSSIKNLNDQNTLYKLATESHNMGVESEAFDKLSDDSLISEIALNGSYSQLRIRAINKLQVKSTLERIASEEKDSVIKESALKRIAEIKALNK
jgi:hypothetical protein